MQFAVKAYRDGPVMGPYSAKDITDLVASGKMGRNFLVQSEGEQEWTTISDRFGLRAPAEPRNDSATTSTRKKQLISPALLVVVSIIGFLFLCLAPVYVFIHGRHAVAQGIEFSPWTPSHGHYLACWISALWLILFGLTVIALDLLVHQHSRTTEGVIFLNVFAAGLIATVMGLVLVGRYIYLSFA